MGTCSKCGAENTGSKFCPECGNNLSEIPAADSGVAMEPVQTEQASDVATTETEVLPAEGSEVEKVASTGQTDLSSGNPTPSSETNASTASESVHQAAESVKDAVAKVAQETSNSVKEVAEKVNEAGDKSQKPMLIVAVSLIVIFVLMIGMGSCAACSSYYSSS